MKNTTPCNPLPTNSSQPSASGILGIAMSNQSLVLFNGLEVTDHPPGEVGRYRQLMPGSWLSARILVYVYPSFPQLWSPASGASGSSSSALPDECDEGTGFQYKWRRWVESLEAMPKNSGAWVILSRHLATVGTSSGQVSDISRAIMELCMRDAEIQRNPSRLMVYKAKDTVLPITPEEQGIMTRIRSATGYEPRLRRVEKCIYLALAAYDTAIIHQIAENAPDNCAVRDVVIESRF